VNDLRKALERLVVELVAEARRHDAGGERPDDLINSKHTPITHEKVRKLVQRGTIRGYRDGKDLLVVRSELYDYLKRNPIDARERRVEPPSNTELDSGVVAAFSTPASTRLPSVKKAK